MQDEIEILKRQLIQKDKQCKKVQPRVKKITFVSSLYELDVCIKFI